LKNAHTLVGFLIRAIVVGLATAFLVVWWKPSLLRATPLASVAAVSGITPAGTKPVPAAGDSRAAAATPAGASAAALTAAPAAALAPIVVASFADAVARAAPAVVNIYTARVVTERTTPPPIAQLFGDYLPVYRQHVERALGSGVIVSDKGTVVTNQHVINGADSIKVQLADGRVAAATLVGQDPDTDLAVLRLGIGIVPTMPLGRSDRLRVGDIVLAIGNPYGLSQTVTQGIVSATGRGQLGLATFENFIQTDAAINLGNSGGALIDARGDLVGINTAVLDRSANGGAGPEGIGFAIPVNLVRGVTEQILAHGHVVRGWLGIIPQDISEEDAASAGVPSPAVVVGFVPQISPAYEAGIRRGDLITRLGGDSIASAHELASRIAQLHPGDDVEVEGLRGHAKFKLTMRVHERPQNSAHSS
jgi:serine peptidase DegS